MNRFDPERYRVSLMKLREMVIIPCVRQPEPSGYSISVWESSQSLIENESGRCPTKLLRRNLFCEFTEDCLFDKQKARGLPYETVPNMLRGYSK